MHAPHRIREIIFRQNLLKKSPEETQQQVLWRDALLCARQLRAAGGRGAGISNRGRMMQNRQITDGAF